MCRTSKDKAELIRLVARRDAGGVSVDLTGKASGRGAYLCRTAACQRLPGLPEKLARALKINVSKQDVLLLQTELFKA
jgi:hypothetical protein